MIGSSVHGRHWLERPAHTGAAPRASVVRWGPGSVPTSIGVAARRPSRLDYWKPVRSRGAREHEQYRSIALSCCSCESSLWRPRFPRRMPTGQSRFCLLRSRQFCLARMQRCWEPSEYLALPMTPAHPPGQAIARSPLLTRRPSGTGSWISSRAGFTYDGFLRLQPGNRLATGLHG